MKIYRSNKKNKRIYEKINYIKLCLVIIVPFILLSIIFYYIGGREDIVIGIKKSLLVSLLLGVGSIVGDLIDNRSRVFLIGDEIGYIDIHSEKVGGAYLRDDDFWDILDKNEIIEVYTNNYKYEGIDKNIIKRIISVKKKYNRMVIKANVLTKEWKSSSIYTISRLFVVEKERIKKIIIPSDFDNYDDLYKNLVKRIDI